MASDTDYMRDALELAARGVGAVEPNPPVGALIVRDLFVLGTGRHERYGGPHAEAAALADAAARGNDVRGATLYVTLEPCCGFAGKKTPPCCEVVVAAGLSRVVVAVEDPDPNVAGRGVARLREAGVAVDVGPAEVEARELLRAYAKLRTQRRPWVIAKWAQTTDGYIALDGQGTSGHELRQWISNETSRYHAHEWRGIADGVLVGVGTVIADDPMLTDRRLDAKKQPTRVILDASLRTPPDCRLIRTAGDVPTIVATTVQALCEKPRAAETLRAAGAEVLETAHAPLRGSHPEPNGQTEGVDIDRLLDVLGERNWTRLIVEGGPTVLRSFLDPRLADELHVYVSPLQAEDTYLPHFDLADVVRAGRYIEIEVEDLQGDTLYILRRA
jgi:diaminohydroxyphosphoribosylaminopyrimidine deaminase/5-amino-6-(5-phosphoribosylamino)uracil reductase